jgi:hypothetical protein
LLADRELTLLAGRVLQPDLARYGDCTTAQSREPDNARLRNNEQMVGA